MHAWLGFLREPERLKCRGLDEAANTFAGVFRPKLRLAMEGYVATASAAVSCREAVYVIPQSIEEDEVCRCPEEEAGEQGGQRGAREDWLRLRDLDGC